MPERTRRSRASRCTRARSYGLLAGGLSVLCIASACGRTEAEAQLDTQPEPRADPPAPPLPSGDEEGVKVAQELLAQWKRAHPDRSWVQKEQETHDIVPPVDNSDLVGNPQGATYARITELDVRTWERETLKLVTEGSRIFHDAEQLGSTNGVSCDMCHPDGSNTHAETYPKFQVQMGRVALLRDMINWCIEQPVRGERLDADDPKMRALEAYIVAQRKGTPLAYGKR